MGSSSNRESLRPLTDAPQCPEGHTGSVHASKKNTIFIVVDQQLGGWDKTFLDFSYRIASQILRVLLKWGPRNLLELTPSICPPQPLPLTLLHMEEHVQLQCLHLISRHLLSLLVSYCQVLI